MSTTILYENRATITLGGHASQRCPDELLDRYKALVDDQRMSWTEHLRLMKLLGSGGQGVVYLSGAGLMVSRCRSR
jgi:serine/threonine-protein kinase